MPRAVSKKFIAAYNHGYAYCAVYSQRIGHIDALTKTAKSYYTEERLVRAFQDGWMVALNEINTGALTPAVKRTK